MRPPAQALWIRRCAQASVLVLWALMTACAPSRLIIPEPDYAEPAAQMGPAVDLQFPVDARPAAERGDGGWYTTSLPLPFVTHGDANLEPSGLGAVHRASDGALTERGIATDPDAEIGVRLYVLHHAGTRDVSDAQWTSTLTGGIAGYVGKLVYPAFFVAYSSVRVEVETPEGRVLRDVHAYSTRRMPFYRTWGILTLWRRNHAAEAMTAALVDVHTEIGRGVADVVDQARTGTAITAGEPANADPSHSLGIWTQADSFRRNVPVWVAAKYPSDRFSLMTGHDTVKGEVVGRIALPLDTLGYDVGLSDRLQWQLDVTLLGVANQAGTGLRYRLLRHGDLAFSMQLGGQLDLVLPPSEGFKPSLAAVSFRGSGIASWRPDEVTWYLRGGWSSRNVRRAFDELPELEEGAAVTVAGAPGLEVQLSATTVLAFEVRASATFQNGDPLALGRLGTVVVIPQLALGLR